MQPLPQSVPRSDATDAAMMVRRVTPMHIVDDVARAGLAFQALGFERVETERSAECLGWRASNGSSVIVTARAMIAREFGPAVAERIGAAVIPYVWVESVPCALEELIGHDHAAEVLGQVITDYDTVEAIVRTTSGYMLLAQRLRAVVPGKG